MNISSQSNNINFGKVFAVAGDPKQFSKLHNVVRNSKGRYGLYSLDKKKLPGEAGDIFLKNAKKDKKSVYIIVAGQDDIDNIILSKKGWKSLQSICNKVTSFIDLKNVDKDIKPVLEAMKK